MRVHRLRKIERIACAARASRTTLAGRAVQARSGFTLVEVSVVTLVLVLTIAAVSASIGSTGQLLETGRETALAYEGLRAAAEELQAAPVTQAFASFNDDPNDDPGGAGAAPGSAFDVLGLSPQADDPDGRVGRIVFPTVGGALREDLDDPGLGLPRDLSGDGVVDAADHADDYVVLPARVIVEWRGANGDRSLAVEVVVTP